MAGGEIVLGVDAADEGVEVFDLLFGRLALLDAGSAAHLLGLFEVSEPLVDLVGEAAVGGDLYAVGVDVDVALEGARAFGVGDEHGAGPVRVLMGGEADGVVGIAVAEEVDLVDFELGVFGGVDGDAVIDGERDVAVGEEGDDVVDVLERGAAGGDDDGLLGLGDLFDEHPVVDVGAGDLDDGDAEFDAEVDGALVEWRGHGDAAGFADGLDEGCEMLVGEAGVEGFFDVADIGAVDEVLVDEVLDVAELELDGGADIVEPDDLRELAGRS